MAQALTIQDNHLQTSAEIGLACLAVGVWPAPGVDEFLGVMALRIVLAGSLVGDVERVEKNGVTRINVRIDGRPMNPERQRAAALLFAPLGVYADMAGISKTYAAANDTGAVPVPLIIAGGVVQIALIAGGAYVLTYAATEAAKIVDGALRRNSASRAVQAADAQAIAVINQHVQREKVAGKIIEFDAVERSVLDALQSRIANIVKQAYLPADFGKNLPSWVFPVVGLVGAAAVVSAFYFVRSE